MVVAFVPWLRLRSWWLVEMASPAAPRRVCVTGGGGYIASWLVKILLSRGYAVHATVRDPSAPKNAHLLRLDGAAEKLRLFKADVLDTDALVAAVTGCEGVFHVASPVPSVKVVDPEDWYMAAKTLAEETALEYAEKNGLTVVTVCPCVVLGPLLQPVVNTSSEFLIYVIKGGPTVMNNMLWHIVDVRDVADALLLVYEKEESSGRYICAPDRINTKDLLNILKKTRPDYNYVNCDNDSDLKSIFTPITSEKLKNLGWKPRKMEETLSDTIEYYEKAGLLKDVEGCPCRLPHPFHMATDK